MKAFTLEENVKVALGGMRVDPPLVLINLCYFNTLDSNLSFNLSFTPSCCTVRMRKRKLARVEGLVECWSVLAGW